MSATEEQLKNRAIWIAALDSGKFPQGVQELGCPATGMCCLGVGCYVLGVKYNPRDPVPPAEFCKKVGLPTDEIIDFDGTYEGGSLVEDNDSKKLSFPQIAKIISTTDSLWEGSAFQDAVLDCARQDLMEDW